MLSVPPPRQAQVLRQVGLPESAATGECTAPLSRVVALVDELARMSQAPDAFGVRMAGAIPEGTYGEAELVVRTAATLARGLVALVRFASLINPLGRFEYLERKDRAELHYSVPALPGALGRHLNEYTIAYITRALGKVSPAPLNVLEAWFPHARHPGADATADALGAPVRFRAATCGFALTLDQANQPLRSSDAVVCSFMQQRAEARLAELGEMAYAGRVLDLVEKQTGLAGVTLKKVARLMATTPRSIQRHLADDGTSFREVVDQVRQRQAERMLATGAPASRVAEQLGFADVRCLRRAEARWRRESARKT